MVVYDYQTRLQGVANSLGIELATLIGETDNAVVKLLQRELTKKVVGNSASAIKKELERLKKLIAKIEQLRKPSYKAVKDLLLSTSADVVQAGTDETAKEANRLLGEQARAEREKRFCKTLTDAQQRAIFEYSSIDGKTIAEWFQNWQRSDLENIANAVQRASVEQMTVRDITRLIRGTRENNYADGILASTQTSAVRLARTVINGVSNNARVETIKANQDVIDGVKFVGTLDGKTCIYCASLDGQIWRDDEMGQARRPPIHPNCRCTLIPYVELKDDDGNVVDLEETRPAANADFDKLAKDAYNQNARDKGLNRRWEDLSPSTRLKYYYQAQKDYEKRTGNKAYEQVSGSTSFAEYFENQDESFKRSWLGAKRYELYKRGSLSDEKLFQPELSFRNSPVDLFKSIQDNEENLDYLRFDGDFITSYKEQTEPKESIFDYDKVLENIQTSSQVEEFAGFEEQNSVGKAEKFIFEKFGIKVKYPRLFAPFNKGMKSKFVNVANDMNMELCRAFKMFGTVGLINEITFDPSLRERNSFGSYNKKTFTLKLRPDFGRSEASDFVKKQPPGYLSTNSPLHGYRHEIGHAIYNYCLERLDRHSRQEIERKIATLHKLYCIPQEKAVKSLSGYSYASPSEMVAEAIAKSLNNESNELTTKILKVLLV